MMVGHFVANHKAAFDETEHICWQLGITSSNPTPWDPEIHSSAPRLMLPITLTIRQALYNMHLSLDKLWHNFKDINKYSYE